MYCGSLYGYTSKCESLFFSNIDHRVTPFRLLFTLPCNVFLVSVKMKTNFIFKLLRCSRTMECLPGHQWHIHTARCWELPLSLPLLQLDLTT
jgi:hypothetical protein